MNDEIKRTLQSVPTTLAAMTLMLLVICNPALADTKLSASAITGFEHNSNLFALQSGLSPADVDFFDSSDATYSAGATGRIDQTIGDQTIYGSGTATLYRYRDNSILNHTTYDFAAGTDLKLGRRLSGTLGASARRALLPFSEQSTPRLVLQQEQRQHGTARLLLGRRLRVEADGVRSSLQGELQRGEEMTLRERSGAGTLRFLGDGAWSVGLRAQQLSGRYSRSRTLNPEYDQTSRGVVADYQNAAGTTTLAFQLGHTDRDSDYAPSALTATTGDIFLTRKLTYKTSIQIGGIRAIKNYASTLGSVLETNRMVAVSWQPTFRAGVVVSHSWIDHFLPGQGNAPVGSDRNDDGRVTRLEFTYSALRWLTAKPFISFESRKSNFVGGNFDGTSFGFEIVANWPPAKDEEE